jgi:hypothetical protein
MQYLAMFAVMAMLGAGAGGATVMAAGFGHGAPGDAQSQNQWTGPADFGNGTCSGGAYGDPLLADDDGDGIPNGQDADWTAPLDGTGYQYAHCAT